MTFNYLQWLCVRPRERHPQVCQHGIWCHTAGMPYRPPYSCIAPYMRLASSRLPPGAIQPYSPIQRCMSIQLYSTIHYTAHTTPLWILRLVYVGPPRPVHVGFRGQYNCTLDLRGQYTLDSEASTPVRWIPRLVHLYVGFRASTRWISRLVHVGFRG